MIKMEKEKDKMDDNLTIRKNYNSIIITRAEYYNKHVCESDTSQLHQIVCTCCVLL